MTLHKEKPVKEAEFMHALPEPEAVCQPSEPVRQLSEPGSQPPEPVSQPPESVSQPPESVSQFPGLVSQLPKRVSQPPKPVSQPPIQVSQSPKQVSQPPKPVFQPPKPVSQPPEPVSQPPKPVSQPPEPVSQSPKPVSQPPKPVSQPPKPVSQPPEPVSQPPIATQISEPQLILSTTSMTAHHTNIKDQDPSAERELYNSEYPIKNVSESVTSSDKNFKKSPSSHLRRSFSVSNFRSYEISSRSASDELQQKLNKRLNKETDSNALDKLETTVKQHMGKSKAIAENTDASLDKGGHGGIVERKVSLFIYCMLHL